MNKKDKNIVLQMFQALGIFISKNYQFLLVLLISFFILVAIAFLITASSETVYSFSINEFEVGQIADRTIIADKTIPPDENSHIYVEIGEKVIKKGFPITNIAIEKLQKMSSTPAYIDYRMFANKILYLMLLLVLAFILFDSSILRSKISLKDCILLSLFFIICYGLASFSSKISFFSSPYNLPILLPCSFFVLLINLLLTSTHGIYFSFVLSLGILNADIENIVPSLFVLASCIATTKISSKIERRIDMIYISILLALLQFVFMIVLKVIFNNSFTDSIFSLIMIALNGFLSGILAFGFLTPLETLLNTASRFRLMDLSDLNNPIMRKMLLTAPGTYNHSMMVATLAENACREINANPLLARVGAYYHDLGKLDQSEYFVENQTDGNKHDELNPRLSVAVIKSHVKKGIEKARQLRLPPQVIDIISEHHGNSLISFFYNEAKKNDPSVTPEEFSYIGTPPSSKESAVVMLADTVEAACRTLKNPSVSRLEKFIHELVMAKYDHKQLDNSDLSFKDLAIIEDSFVQILAGYYHSRIEYPNQKDPDNGSKTEETVQPVVQEDNKEK